MDKIFEIQIEKSYLNLSNSICISELKKTITHQYYEISGIADNEDQINDLCWCILSFFDYVNEVEMKIESCIGYGNIAKKNLNQELCNRLKIDQNLDEESKRKSRNPLLQEIIGHVLLHIHKKIKIFPELVGEIISCRNPHLNANDSGIDLIAIGLISKKFIPLIGEVKAYEMDPRGGFNDACEKFSQVSRGEYDGEIREALKNLSKQQGINNDDLANCIWKESSNFGAFVGYDINHAFDWNKKCERKFILEQKLENLYLLPISYKNMFELFDHIVDVLVSHSNSLGD